jgi:hypothetical protein
VFNHTTHTGSGGATSDCALCEAHAKAAAAHRAPVRRRSENLHPWFLAIGVSAPAALFLDGAERLISFGLCLGLVAGALLVWRTRAAGERVTARMLVANINELNATADARVTMVTRQFEWAVNDVANLRDALKRAQDARGDAEVGASLARRQIRLLERELYEARAKIGEFSAALNTASVKAPETSTPESVGLVVPLVWHLFEESELQWLRLESAGIAPSQIRILNDANSVIAISAKSLEVADSAQVSIVLRVPNELRAALEKDGELNGFIVEALVDDEWCRVALRDPRPSASARHKDRRGRTRKREEVGSLSA